MSDKEISSTTQEFLDVYDIVNNTVLLKDGTASIILQVGTMNFSLLAEQEQDAIIFTYGSLLNSLNYPIQISIQSQTKDVTKYLRLLDEQIQKASSDRKATLIKQYRDFVGTLIKERNVLEKRFYVTIPASPAEMGLITPSNVLPGKTTFDITSIEKSIILEKAANLLEPRRDHLISQFNRLGLYTRQLNTQEIIQNFYINYNPEAAEGQEISNNENYTTPLVRASFGGKIMQNQMNDTSINNAPQANAPLSPTPQEILSGEPPVDSNATQVVPEETVQKIESQEIPNSTQLNEPSLNIENTPDTSSEPTLTSEPIQPLQAPSQSTFQAPDFNQTAEQTQAVEPIQTIESTPVADSSQTINEPGNNVDLDLKLDANLIDSNQVNSTLPNEPVSMEGMTQTPDLNQDLNQNQNPIETQEASPNINTVQDQNLEQNNFAEEIAPLQNQFEQQAPENTN